MLIILPSNETQLAENTIGNEDRTVDVVTGFLAPLYRCDEIRSCFVLYEQPLFLCSDRVRQREHYLSLSSLVQLWAPLSLIWNKTTTERPQTRPQLQRHRHRENNSGSRYTLCMYYTLRYYSLYYVADYRQANIVVQVHLKV